MLQYLLLLKLILPIMNCNELNFGNMGCLLYKNLICGVIKAPFGSPPAPNSADGAHGAAPNGVTL